MLKSAAVFGGTQGIGLAITEKLLQDNYSVFVSYRESSDLGPLAALAEQYLDKLTIIPLAIENEESYKEFFNTVSDTTHDLKYCINCIGILSSHSLQPERKIEDIDLKSLLHVFMVNTSPTLLIAKYMKPLIRTSHAPIFCSLSAKVGSIQDNKMGGWYSYRISKSALNMSLKNISLEFSRINKNSTTLSIHPGTTESNLSKPFLAIASKKYKIHSTSESAENILNILSACTPSKSNGNFYSWDGSLLPW